MIGLRINGKDVNVDATPDTPLLWVLRDSLAMTGTKFGCGIGQCGACTVHLDGTPARSCQLPVSAIAGKEITTIEGISADGSHPVQQAWIAEQVPQCGYCQSGQIMSAVALLTKTKNPTDATSTPRCRATSAAAGPTSGSDARFIARLEVPSESRVASRESA